MDSSYCANEDCRWNTEVKGYGTFRLMRSGWYCEDCAPGYSIAEPGKDLWQFETSNIAGSAGKSIKVQNLRHLRQLEQQHGVVSVAANYDTARWDQPPRGR